MFLKLSTWIFAPIASLCCLLLFSSSSFFLWDDCVYVCVCKYGVRMWSSRDEEI